MKSKKVLSIILALSMIISMLPTGVFAADEDTTKPTVTAITIGGKDIKTEAAIDIATSGDIVITFSEAVQFSAKDNTTEGSGVENFMNSENLKLEGGAYGISMEIDAYKSADKTLTIHYHRLDNSKEYTLTILNTSIWDLAGNVLAEVTVGGTATTVSLIEQVASFATPSDVAKDYGDVAFTNVASITPTAVEEQMPVYSIEADKTAVATLNTATGEVTVVGLGTAVITVTYPATATAAGATATYTLTVSEKTVAPVIKTTDIRVTGTKVQLSNMITVEGLATGETVDKLLTDWAYTADSGKYATTDGKASAQFYIGDGKTPEEYVAVAGALAIGKTYYADIAIATDAFGANYTVTEITAQGKAPTTETLAEYVKITLRSAPIDDDDDVVVTPPTAPVITPPTQPDATTNAETKIMATVDKNGNAIVTVTNKAISDAIKTAQDAAKKAGVEAKGIGVTIKLITDKVASFVSTTVPKASVDALIAAGVKEVKLESSTVNVSMDLATLKEIQKTVGADATLTAKKVDVKTLSEFAQETIGDRPVFDFSIIGNGKTLSNFNEGLVTVEIPYVLAAGEKGSNIYVVFIDAQGNAVEVSSSAYDVAKKQVIFTTDHFSTYAVAYREVVFMDIENHWAKTDINFVVAKGILNGTAEDLFSPNVSMTRGMFVTALGRLAGAKDIEPTDMFTDVAVNTYYAPYVAWAAEQNIVMGTGTATFSPDKAITRQEMVVIMVNYARAMKLDILKTNAAKVFDDKDEIATWAAEAVATMQMAGAIGGKTEKTFAPTGIATRAEVAAVLHRFITIVK